jgi:8-amino-7-oxononanoate synthase
MQWISENLNQLEQADQLRRLRVRQSPHVAGMIQLDGQQLIDFSSNDYLSLSSDSRLVESVRHAAGQVGWGAGASPLISGFSVLQQKLQNEIAHWKRTEAALLFPSGFAANLGVITALARPRTTIFSDEKNHASIIDGCRLSGADIVIYRHCDATDLADRLAEHPESQHRIIVTDSLFSMDGDIAPLKEIVELKHQYKAMLIVDEAHATGVFGSRGSGLCEREGVEKDVDVRVGTLSKAVGSIGGFAACSNLIYNWLINYARSYIFSTAQPEAISAAAMTAIKIIQQCETPRNELLLKAERFRNECSQMGYDVGNSQSQIVPIIVGQSKVALELSRHLQSCGIFAPAVRHPAVEMNQSRLRVTINAAHTDEQMKNLVDSLSKYQTLKPSV